MDLGVFFDADFSFADHMKNSFKNSCAQLHDLRQQYLMVDNAVLAANALVICWLDYSNSISVVCQVSTNAIYNASRVLLHGLSPFVVSTPGLPQP